MVSRYHWIRTSNNLFLGSGTTQTVYDVTFNIPAGGILKKVIGYGFDISGTQSGNTNLGIGVWNLTQDIRISSGPNNNRIIFVSARRLPMVTTAYTFSFTNEYTSYMNAGDNECSFDQECSYGKSTDPNPWTVRALMAFHSAPGGQNANFGLGKCQFTGSVGMLYYL